MQPRQKLQNRVIEFVLREHPTHFIRVNLHEKLSMMALEDHLNEWVIRVNRFYLGPNWHMPKIRHLAMVGFSDLGRSCLPEDPFISLLVRAPVSADHSDFVFKAALCFMDEFENDRSPWGEMYVDLITRMGTTPEGIAVSFDLQRLS